MLPLVHHQQTDLQDHIQEAHTEVECEYCKKKFSKGEIDNHTSQVRETVRYFSHTVCRNSGLQNDRNESTEE